jgi:hypothetical protein
MRNALALLYVFAEQMHCYGKLKQSWLSCPTWEDAAHTTSRRQFYESKRSMVSDVKHPKKDTSGQVQHSISARNLDPIGAVAMMGGLNKLFG